MAPTYNYYRRDEQNGVPTYKFYNTPDDPEDEPAFVAPASPNVDFIARKLKELQPGGVERRTSDGEEAPPGVDAMRADLKQRDARREDRRLAQAGGEANYTPADQGEAAKQQGGGGAPGKDPVGSNGASAPAADGDSGDTSGSGKAVELAAPPDRKYPQKPAARTIEPRLQPSDFIEEQDRRSTSSTSRNEVQESTGYLRPEYAKRLQDIEQEGQRKADTSAEYRQWQRYHEDQARQQEYTKKAIEEDFNRREAELEQKRRTALDADEAELDKFRKQIQHPDGFWQDKSVGAQIMMGIAVALGTLGTRANESDQGARILDDALTRHQMRLENSYRKQLEKKGRTRESYDEMQRRLAQDRLQALQVVQYQVADQIARSLNPVVRKQFMDYALQDIEPVRKSALEQQVAQDVLNTASGKKARAGMEAAAADAIRTGSIAMGSPRGTEGGMRAAPTASTPSAPAPRTGRWDEVGDTIRGTLGGATKGGPPAFPAEPWSGGGKRQYPDDGFDEMGAAPVSNKAVARQVNAKDADEIDDTNAMQILREYNARRQAGEEVYLTPAQSKAVYRLGKSAVDRGRTSNRLSPEQEQELSTFLRGQRESAPESRAAATNRGIPAMKAAPIFPGDTRAAEQIPVQERLSMLRQYNEAMDQWKKGKRKEMPTLTEEQSRAFYYLSDEGRRMEEALKRRGVSAQPVQQNGKPAPASQTKPLTREQEDALRELLRKQREVERALEPAPPKRTPAQEDAVRRLEREQERVERALGVPTAPRLTPAEQQLMRKLEGERGAAPPVAPGSARQRIEQRRKEIEEERKRLEREESERKAQKKGGR